MLQTNDGKRFIWLKMRARSARSEGEPEGVYSIILLFLKRAISFTEVCELLHKDNRFFKNILNSSLVKSQSAKHS